MKKLLLFKVTIAFTVLYSSICSLSVGSIMYGAYNDQNTLFDFGNRLVYLWMFNPVGLILSIVGLFGKAAKRRYILCIVIMMVMWLSGVMAIVSIF